MSLEITPFERRTMLFTLYIQYINIVCSQIFTVDFYILFNIEYCGIVVIGCVCINRRYRVTLVTDSRRVY